MDGTKSPEIETRTLTELLDRVETQVGRIGLNTPQQALTILHLLDGIMLRMEEMENSTSRKAAEGQLDGVLGRMRTEARLFLRDLGGAQALAEAREKVNPPRDNWWWFLDEYRADLQRSSLRRTARTLVISAVVLVILAVVYQIFLAPDPAVAARYQYEQSSRDQLMQGQFAEALSDAEKGLEHAPDDPVLLITKGVALENLGQVEAAEQAYEEAQAGVEHPEDFYLVRGQAYLSAGQTDLAAADAGEAVRLNPDSAQAYLLSGQIHETLSEYQAALDDYDLAFEAAGKSDQPQLAALARTRTAMLMQIINAQVSPFTGDPTPTP